LYVDKQIKGQDFGEINNKETKMVMHFSKERIERHHRSRQCGTLSGEASGGVVGAQAHPPPLGATLPFLRRNKKEEERK
jgi:hypothetical protein